MDDRQILWLQMRRALQGHRTAVKAVSGIEAARQQVKSGLGPIESIAANTGFGDPERMRRAFTRAFGQPPQALRRTARTELR